MPVPNSDQVLLTGATGYIGRHLLERLLAAGHAVTALVRAESEKCAAERLAGVAPHPRLAVRAGDVLWPGFGLADEEWRSFGAVIHAAARPKLGRESAEVLRVIHAGPIMELARLRERGLLRRLLHVSTAYVASRAGGCIPEAPAPEAVGANAYETTKLEAEQAVTGMLSEVSEVFRPGIVVPGAGAPELVHQSPLAPFLGSLRVGVGQKNVINASPMVRPGFTHLDEFASFVTGRLESKPRPGACWNVVRQSLTVGELAEVLAGEGLTEPLAFHAGQSRGRFNTWWAYLARDRNWETAATQLEAARLGTAIRGLEPRHFALLAKTLLEHRAVSAA